MSTDDHQALVISVAVRKGLAPDLAVQLRGSTIAELEAHADHLTETAERSEVRSIVESIDRI